MGEAEKGESFTQVGLPKHDCLFTCQFVAFVWASHERQKKRSFSSLQAGPPVLPVCVHFPQLCSTISYKIVLMLK